MNERHVFRPGKRSAEEAAQLRADRERYLRDRPTPDQLLAEGGHSDFVTLAEMLDLQEMGASLKRERERQHLTLAELSAKTGIDAAAISRVENGQNGNPTFQTVLRIASALGKAIRWAIVDLPTTHQQTSMSS